MFISQSVVRPFYSPVWIMLKLLLFLDCTFKTSNIFCWLHQNSKKWITFDRLFWNNDACQAVNKRFVGKFLQRGVHAAEALTPRLQTASLKPTVTSLDGFPWKHFWLLTSWTCSHLCIKVNGKLSRFCLLITRINVFRQDSQKGWWELSPDWVFDGKSSLSLLRTRGLFL